MFRSVLSDGATDFETTYIEDDAQCGHMVSFLVAKNDKTLQRVFVDCKLVYVYAASFWEFSFTISVISLDGSYEEFATQDSRMAAQYIPRGARPAILRLVRDALVALVSLTKAEAIYRVTKGRDLPKKALRKHHFLTEALLSCGYRVAETGTDDFGRMFWLCELAD